MNNKFDDLHVIKDENDIVILKPIRKYYGLLVTTCKIANNRRYLDAIENGYMVATIDSFEVCDNLLDKYLKMDSTKYIQATNYNIDKVLQDVSTTFHINPVGLTMKNRQRNVVEARYTAAYILRKKMYVGNAPITVARIGDILNRHHATILHAMTTVDSLLKFDKHYKSLTNNLLRKYNLS